MKHEEELNDPWSAAQAELYLGPRVINLDDYAGDSLPAVLELKLSTELRSALDTLKNTLRKWHLVFEALDISEYPATDANKQTQQRQMLADGKIAHEIVQALMALESAGAILPRAISANDPKSADKANVRLRANQYLQVQEYLDAKTDNEKSLGEMLDQAPFVEWSRHLLGGFIGDAGIVNMILREEDTFDTIKSEVQASLAAQLDSLRDDLARSSDQAKATEYAVLVERQRRLEEFSNLPRTLLGKVLNEIHLAAPVAQAHRERIEDLFESYGAIVDIFKESKVDPQRFLILGCGPATELFRYLEQTEKRNAGTQKLEFKGVDLALSTLEAFKKNAIVSGREDVDFVTELKNLMRVGIAFKIGKFNEPLDERVFSYCAGLYDYLAKDFAEGIDSLMLEASVPGGFVCATNVASSNPNSNGMRLLLGWDLIYRDREDMRELGELAMRSFHEKHHAGMPYVDGFRADLVFNSDLLSDLKQLSPGEYCVTSTDNGVNLFLWMRREDDQVLQGMRF